ncbi:MAG TPA: helix-turn-helix domain-containing protein [Acidobacteriota bacterium]|nr:helix-turn-helix domain-containing protein [Acidobacteriota bacterium]
MTLWRVDQAADFLGIRPKTLYEWVRTGKVPHRKLGFNVRFDRDELERWVESQPGAAGVDAPVNGDGQSGELAATAAAAALLMLRIESDLGQHLSFPQRREIKRLARQLQAAADIDG